jgi:pimeloyl-ACP methyl ester carboxylesterase
MQPPLQYFGRLAIEEHPAVTSAGEGAQRGAALVLLHAWPTWRIIWRDAVGALALPRPRCLLVDLPGFGDSPAGGPFTIAGVARDLRDALKELDALPAVIAGVSMGGCIALALADQFISDVAGLILCDTRADADPPANRPNRQAAIDLCRAHGAAAVAAAQLPRMISPATAAQPDRAAQLLAIMADCPPGAIIFGTEALRDREDRSGVLGRLACPVLVLVGEEDSITTPAMAEEMASRISNSSVRIIPKAGHLAVWEDPAATAAHISTFMAAL